MIYCIEDDRGIRDLMIYTLKVSGFEAEGFPDAAAFRAALEREAPEFILLDITEKEKAEKLRREFTANVSHELKTPLHSISGCAELLTGNLIESGDVPRFVQQIYSEAKRMIALVDDIISLSGLDEGVESPRQDVDFYEIAGLAVRELTPAADEARVTLKLEGESAVLSGDPRLLSQIVFNLCDNAIKYNRSGGSVTVGVSAAQNAVILTVSDTGIGIPADQRERIFERFYRVDKSRSKEVGGTGLGLSIVKHAAKLHRAEIEVQSESEKGTTIRVIFPK